MSFLKGSVKGGMSTINNIQKFVHKKKEDPFNDYKDKVIDILKNIKKFTR